jgi:hypothetical protein
VVPQHRIKLHAVVDQPSIGFLELLAIVVRCCRAFVDPIDSTVGVRSDELGCF